MVPPDRQTGKKKRAQSQLGGFLPRRFFPPAGVPDAAEVDGYGDRDPDPRSAGMMPFTETVIAAAEMNRAADVR